MAYFWIDLLFISSKYFLGTLPRNLKSSCTVFWSQRSMQSRTEVDKIPITGLPVLGETPRDTENSYFEMFVGFTNVVYCPTQRCINQTWP